MKEEDYLTNLSINAKILLKWIPVKWSARLWTRFHWIRVGLSHHLLWTWLKSVKAPNFLNGLTSIRFLKLVLFLPVGYLQDVSTHPFKWISTILFHEDNHSKLFCVWLFSFFQYHKSYSYSEILSAIILICTSFLILNFCFDLRVDSCSGSQRTRFTD
jgi:hypothetical protein